MLVSACCISYKFSSSSLFLSNTLLCFSSCYWPSIFSADSNKVFTNWVYSFSNVAFRSAFLDVALFFWGYRFLFWKLIIFCLVSVYQILDQCQFLLWAFFVLYEIHLERILLLLFLCYWWLWSRFRSYKLYLPLRNKNMVTK